MTLRELVLDYLRTVGSRSRLEFHRLAKAHIIPHLGHLHISLVSVKDAHRLHQLLKDTPVQANRVLSVLSAALRHAERTGLRPVGSNPCAVVKHFPERKRKRYARPEEMAKVMALLRQEEEAHPREVLFLRLLMLTGARPDEIRRARWADIEGETLVLQEHKTDRTGDARRVYLPREAMALLEAAPRDREEIVGNCGYKRLWAQIRREAGCEDLRIYDLRHTFASTALKAGYSLGAIGELLGHKSTATTARYAHLMDGAAQDMARKVGSAIAQTEGL